MVSPILWHQPARRRPTKSSAATRYSDKVVVHNHLIGGGFGRRLETDGIVRAVEIAQGSG
jgi:isoquinoline 1-oxidoreductase beta subunit